jgi:hypothetical protein
MAGGGGSVLTRGEEAATFIAGRKAVGGAPCAQRQPSCGVGRGMAGVRRKGAATCGGRRANGGAWAAQRGQRARTTWLGQGPTDVTHRDQGAWRTDHWARAGLGVRAWPIRRQPTWPGASSAATSCARGALALKQFNVALFDCLFLMIFEQK